MSSRVVVSGLGAVTPLGHDADTTWAELLAGRSGIGYVSHPRLPEFPGAIGGEVRDFRPEDHLPMKQVRHMDRYSQMGLIAAIEALRDAGLAGEASLGPRAGVAFSSGFGGFGVIEGQQEILTRQSARRVSPFALSGLLHDSASGHLAILTGAMGPNMAVTSASATGASVIGEAAEIIRRGDADLVIAGAAEAPITPLLYAAFSAMRAIAVAGDDPASACRPFDLKRTGFVVAEGAAAVVLESLEHARRRRATVYAEVAGYGCANDAFDMVASEPTGRGPVISMSAALRKAGMQPEEIGYVNAHGTASVMNDRVETIALKRVFGECATGLPVSSTKSMTGHLMGAAGALEAVISILALRDGVIPPTLNYEHADPECDLDYVPGEARPAPGLDAVLTHSIGLGGHNATLIFKRLRE